MDSREQDDGPSAAEMWRQLSKLRKEVAATEVVKEFDWELYEWYLREDLNLSPETVKARLRHLRFIAGLSRR